jgi:hypothetical protein
VTQRAWRLVAGAYALLALGAIICVVLFARQADDLDSVNDRLVKTAIAYCQAGIAPDAQESQVLDELSRSTYHPGELDPICRRIGDQIRGVAP